MTYLDRLQQLNEAGNVLAEDICIICKSFVMTPEIKERLAAAVTKFVETKEKLLGDSE